MLARGSHVPAPSDRPGGRTQRRVLPYCLCQNLVETTLIPTDDEGLTVHEIYQFVVVRSGGFLDVLRTVQCVSFQPSSVQLPNKASSQVSAGWSFDGIWRHKNVRGLILKLEKTIVFFNIEVKLDVWQAKGLKNVGTSSRVSAKKEGSRYCFVGKVEVNQEINARSFNIFGNFPDGNSTCLLNKILFHQEVTWPHFRVDEDDQGP